MYVYIYTYSWSCIRTYTYIHIYICTSSLLCSFLSSLMLSFSLLSVYVYAHVWRLHMHQDVCCTCTYHGDLSVLSFLPFLPLWIRAAPSFFFLHLFCFKFLLGIGYPLLPPLIWFVPPALHNYQRPLRVQSRKDDVDLLAGYPSASECCIHCIPSSWPVNRVELWCRGGRSLAEIFCST